ncbi:MBL fold metallo-hydrolase [uncultured Phenylobacterium sp.]|uniref:MBL fold metallo-hydrolase n=1 Tax=uncultured Phenylobacterium sp. TaxID=349273 RepID=UPI0025D7E3D5|nr:MBL fold metallo-hydrolase [uncultured Phenylobacterium sp.]
MTTKWALGAVLALAIGAPQALAQAQDFSKVEVKAAKVAGNVYMLTGAGGNIAAVVGPDGIVIVDDQFLPLADKIRAALKGISDQPVRFVINTHYHYDHAGGNAAFGGAGATIVAQDNVRKRLAAGGIMGNGGSMKQTSEAQPPAALPIVTFGHDLTLHLNGETIRAIHAPHGHTDGDAIVYFPRANVVHTGDVFVTYGFPFIDIPGGGTSAGIIAGLEAMLAHVPADVKIIPGHGPVSAPADVRKYIAMLKATRAAVQAGIKSGKSLEALKAAKVLAPWQANAGGFITADLFTETLYNELTGQPGGAPVKHN